MTEIRIYTPESGLRKPAKLFIELFADIFKAGPLGFRLAYRNINAKYRQSIFGLFWALIPPLATSMIWIILNSQKVVSFESGTLPYPVFVLIGTLIWQIFSESLTGVINEMTINQSLLTKINFPRESLIVSTFIETTFNGLIKILMIILVLVVFGIPLQWSIFAGLFGILLFQFLGIGIGLFLVPISTLYKDIQFGMTFILQFLMYLTPVVYPAREFTGVLTLLNYNPLSTLIEFSRNAITGQTVDHGSLLYSILLVFILILPGLILYRLAMPILIERMGS